MESEQITQDETALRVEDLSIVLEGRKLLKNVSFDVPSRKITALVGHSGTGKSILLKTIVGILREEINPENKLIYSGKVLFHGNNLLELQKQNLLEEVRRKIVYISQHPFAFPMTIYENVKFALEYWNPDFSHSELADRVESALRKVGLWKDVQHRLDTNPYDLSAGQLQKLSIARAIALEPDILLLDEPCAYVDPVSTITMEDSFHEIKENLTILMVTHNLRQASRVSNVTLFMTAEDSSGYLVEYALTENIFTNPQQKATSDYIRYSD